MTTDDYQSLCEQGRLAATQIGNGKWTIGALAVQIATRYREHSMDEFARQINLKKRRVYEYAAVWRYYNTDIVRYPHYLDERPTLSYTHLLDAMRLDNLEQSLAFLEECADNGWTADESELWLLERLGKPVPGHKILSANARVLSWNNGELLLSIPGASLGALSDAFYNRRDVEVTIRERGGSLRAIMKPGDERRMR